MIMLAVAGGWAIGQQADRLAYEPMPAITRSIAGPNSSPPCARRRRLAQDRLNHAVRQPDQGRHRTAGSRIGLTSPPLVVLRGATFTAGSAEPVTNGAAFALAGVPDPTIYATDGGSGSATGTA